jgi:hypothetical protein
MRLCLLGGVETCHAPQGNQDQRVYSHTQSARTVRVEERCELRQLRSQLIGDFAPLRFGRVGVILGEGGADEGADHPPALPAGMGERVAHEVDAAALPAGVQDFGDGGLDALVASEITSLTPRRPRRASLRRKAVQKVSASDGPISMPRISRRPSPLTPTATITATETMRPCWRTFTDVASTLTSRPRLGGRGGLHLLVNLLAQPPDLALGDPVMPSTPLPRTRPCPTRPGRKCYPCLRNEPLPMCPERTTVLLVPAEGFEPPTP